MPDPRFYVSKGPVSLSELALLVGAELALAAGEVMIAGSAVLGHAGPEDITYLSQPRHLPDLQTCKAAACFVTPELASFVPPGCTAIAVTLPTAAYALATERLVDIRIHAPDDPFVHPEALIETGAMISPTAVVGAGAQIGAGTYVGPGAVIGPGVAIGRCGYVGAHAVIGFALIGDRVRILAGAIIGEAGFGATLGPTGIIDIPQLGRVILQDGVTVGAGSCIDRGAFDDTVIGENTKIDNLVQIGHNVSIGRNCVLAAHTGISGSVTIGEGCQFGGRAGVADHLSIGAGARIGAAAGVMNHVPAGESWGGYPAQPVRKWMREVAWLRRARQESVRAGSTR